MRLWGWITGKSRCPECGNSDHVRPPELGHGWKKVGGDEDMTAEEFDAAVEAGEPVELNVQLRRPWMEPETGRTSDSSVFWALDPSVRQCPFTRSTTCQEVMDAPHGSGLCCKRYDQYPTELAKMHFVNDGEAQCGPCANRSRIGVCTAKGCQCECRYRWRTPEQRQRDDEAFS